MSGLFHGLPLGGNKINAEAEECAAQEAERMKLPFSLFDPHAAVDRETTAMQDLGFCDVTGLTLAQAMQIVDNLGIDPHTVGFASQMLVTIDSAEKT
jgi:hypothetical protein